MFKNLSLYKNVNFPNNFLVESLIETREISSNKNQKVESVLDKIGNEYNFEQKQAIANAFQGILLVSVLLFDSWSTRNGKN